MATGKYINSFSAADIEKYHRGQLSKAEMHAMEKAAMEDPFLADALEGYALIDTNTTSHITELKERLANRIGGARILTMDAGRNRNFNLLRVAVILAFVAGAALLVYQFGFNQKKDDIAQAKTIQNPIATVPDSTPASHNQVDGNTGSAPETSKPINEAKDISRRINEGGKPTPIDLEPKPGLVENTPVNRDRGVATGTVTPTEEVKSRKSEVQPITTAPRSAEDRFDKMGEVNSRADDKKEAAKQLRKQSEKEEAIRDENNQAAMNKTTGGNRGVDLAQNNNTFRGRVTDADNRGVPFANVSKAPDNNVNTYTDVQGYFNLNARDSIVNVQVRSIGFEEANVQLRNNVPTNRVILKDDQNNTTDVVLGKNTNTAQRKTGNTLKPSETEPVDGWEKYDAYLLNNLNVSKDSKLKQVNGNVEVSFEVNKIGQPSNIKIEKSLCNACDKEAIRLVREGPKWRRQAKKQRTTVTVPF